MSRSHRRRGGRSCSGWRTSPVTFLSAEDVPLEVLQVTGMLLDRQGNILRAGGEGIISKDTPFWVQIFEAREGIDDAALHRLVHEERRDDLRGAPLTWQNSLEVLFGQLPLLPTSS